MADAEVEKEHSCDGGEVAEHHDTEAVGAEIAVKGIPDALRGNEKKEGCFAVSGEKEGIEGEGERRGDVVVRLAWPVTLDRVRKDPHLDDEYARRGDDHRRHDEELQSVAHLRRRGGGVWLNVHVAGRRPGQLPKPAHRHQCKRRG